MGAKVISPECIVHLRNYSRSAAIELNIRLKGIGAASVSVAAFQAMYGSISAIAKAIRSAPDWLKVALFVVAMFILLDPASRARLSGVLSNLQKFVTNVAPTILDLITSGSTLADKHREEQKRHLALAKRELS
jgi:hypothetical protein